MKTTIDLNSIAYENGLEYIESVRGGNNGYPSGIEGGIIGFSSFDEAKEFANKYNLWLCTFHKKAGWQMYEREGQPYEPLKVTSSDYGDDYSHYDSEDAEVFFEEYVSPMLGEFDNFDDLQAFIDEHKIIYEELQSIDETQLVITCMGRYYETIDKESMSWSHDSNEWVIGVTK